MRRSDRILAALLAEQRVRRQLAAPLGEPAVLHEAVELAGEQASVATLPPEVGEAIAEDGRDAHLQLRRRRTEPVQQDAAPGLPHRLGSCVGELEHPRGATLPARTLELERRRDRTQLDEATCQGRVERGDRIHLSPATRQVRQGEAGRATRDPVLHHDVVPVDLHVRVPHAGLPAGRRGVADREHVDGRAEREAREGERGLPREDNGGPRGGHRRDRGQVPIAPIRHLVISGVDVPAAADPPESRVAIDAHDLGTARADEREVHARTVPGAERR
ncbi:hypothetical protein [Agrococcus terreus]|uniref:hypothetical protein n=1 Tax=Agrococcus terreus TaxID=574649 RepID=UPI00166447C1|nr:hypothetical protein [Agrococcus terreus]